METKTMNLKEVKESKESKDSKDLRDSKESKDSKDSKDLKEKEKLSFSNTVGKFLTLNQILADEKIMCNSNLSELDIAKDAIYVQPLTLSNTYYAPHFSETMSVSIPNSKQVLKRWLEYNINTSKSPFYDIPPHSRIVVQSNEVLYSKIKIKVNLDTRQGIVVHFSHMPNGRVNFVIFNHNPVPAKLYSFFSIASCRFFASRDTEFPKMSRQDFDKMCKASEGPWNVLPVDEQTNIIRVRLVKI